MFCRKCGMKLEDNMKFCSRCGEKVSSVTNSNEREVPQREKKGIWKIGILGLLIISIVTVTGISLISFFGKKEKEDTLKYAQEENQEIQKAKEVEENQKDTKQETDFEQQKETILAAYEKYIEENRQGELLGCNLIFLNEDTVPECVYYTEDDLAQFYMLSYKEGKIEAYSAKNGAYQERKGILVHEEGNTDQGFKIGRLQEDGTFESKEIGIISIENGKAKYTIDGKKVKKKKFWNHMDSYGKFTVLPSNTYPNIHEAYENLKQDEVLEEHLLSGIYADHIEEMVDTEESSNQDFVLENSSTAYLSESDLTALTPEQLRIARNEIYARHGYNFTTDEMKSYFGAKSWYTPSDAEWSEDQLNEYEMANRDLIVAYEEKIAAKGETAAVSSGKMNNSNLLEEWKTIYLSYIEDIVTQRYSNVKINFIYVDHDNIPELLLKFPGGLFILAIKNKEVQEIIFTNKYLDFSYIEKTGLFLIESGWQHLYDDEVWELESGNFKQIADGAYGADDVGDTPYHDVTEAHYTYYWNEEQLSKNQYEEKLQSTFDFSKKKEIDFYNSGITYEEFLASYEEEVSSNAKKRANDPEEENIVISLNENDKLIIGDIIQGAFMIERWRDNESLDTDEGKRVFLFSYRHGGHLEELMTPYKVDDYTLQMTEAEVNHLLDMAIGRTMGENIDSIVDGGYIRKEDGKFLLVPADKGDYEYSTRVDTVKQQGKEVVITGKVYEEEMSGYGSYKEYDYRCTFKINEQSIFVGLTLQDFILLSEKTLP